ncbi:probable L-type lectin-domain containing receptor kinase S.5 [Diospyros lotus]|uniref:probable L-type lectin-domain containing receptor kinase S.5 n=1 Tax=Diospyros lotus TaxID=55363 RepID=UPI0022564109|nr:probable L-type lectin-domain containing receptor kinase S.5 [Diospyros lotus]
MGLLKLQSSNYGNINNGALQITLDSAGDVDLTNQSGRILLKNRFKLWQGSGGPNITCADRVASFNTSFLINIYRINNATPGEGLAFVVALDLKIPLNNHGQFLGLTNSTSDGVAANQILAVQLDSFKQPSIDDTFNIYHG